MIKTALLMLAAFGGFWPTLHDIEEKDQEAMMMHLQNSANAYEEGNIGSFLYCWDSFEKIAKKYPGLYNEFEFQDKEFMRTNWIRSDYNYKPYTNSNKEDWK